MAFEVGSIMARLQLDSSGYTRGILNAQSMNSVFGNSVTQFINNPLLGTIGIFKSLAVSMKNWIVDTAGAAESVQRLSNQTGISTQTIQALRAEFELAGRPIQQADQALRALAIRLGQAREQGGPLADTFAKLGVSIDAMQNTDDVFNRSVEALGAFGTVAEGAAMSAQIFGEEAGPALLETVRGGGGLDEITAKMTDFGRVMAGDDLERMATFNTRLGEMNQIMQGLQQTVATSFIKGFVGDAGLDPDDLRDVATAIKDEVGPAIENLGKTIRQIIDDLERIRDFSTNPVSYLLGSPQTREGFQDPEGFRQALQDDQALRQLNNAFRFNPFGLFRNDMATEVQAGR